MQHTERQQPTSHQKNATQAGKGANLSKKHDAISLLSEDHEQVKKLFKEFQKLRGHKDNDEKKKALVQEICVALTIHAKVEEELFYPAVSESAKDRETLDEAYVEHASAKELIQQLQSMHPGEKYYDAKVIVLGEYVNHHIDEEEGKIFPMVKKAKIDTEMLGEKIMQRKEELNLDQAEVSMSMLSKM